MRLKKHAAILESSLTRVLRPTQSSCLHKRTSCRYSSSSSSAHPQQIAVLGGGISGLASALYIGKEFPKSKITLFEGRDHVGGWIQSERVEVDGGSVLFEHGPRTLRPGFRGLPTAQLIDELGLFDEVLWTGRSAPAAKNRYIYYPDRLNRLPGPNIPFLELFADVWKGVSSGLLKGATGFLYEVGRPKRPSNLSDESVGSFISRRFNKHIAENVLSAIVHGVYAGDIWQLSARAIAPYQWRLEGQYGSVINGLYTELSQQQSPESPPSVPPELVGLEPLRDIELQPQTQRQMWQSSTYTFKGGLQGLVDSLKTRVEQNAMVTIQTSSPVKSFDKAKDGSGKVTVVAGNEPSPTPKDFDLVISTLPSPGLTDSVTVMVVNLWYPDANLLRGLRGFGYLIPQSVPFEQNPERALGVIFDSESGAGQDTVPGTKLTVMLGGHWWNGWSEYPDAEEGLDLARNLLRRHLGIEAQPAKWQATLNKNCIPQYTVGYNERLKNLSLGLTNDFGGRLKVVGNQFHGVGVNDCVRNAYLLARSLRGSGWKDRSCGLDHALKEY